MTESEPPRRRRYLPLFYRVAGTNALLLIAAVVVTLVVLAPRKFSSFAVDEAVVLVAGLVLVGLEAERLRIAQELHDQVGQELTAVLLGLARVHRQIEAPLRDEVT